MDTRESHDPFSIPTECSPRSESETTVNSPATAVWVLVIHLQLLFVSSKCIWSNVSVPSSDAIPVAQAANIYESVHPPIKLGHWIILDRDLNLKFSTL